MEIKRSDGVSDDPSKHLAPRRRSPNYDSATVQEALEQLASIDLIELCNEAKVEQCRATRDLRSCGRDVQHALISCGHASLCVECSQRCDICPICRNPVPKNGNRLRLRLYNKCDEAGLLSKRNVDTLQGEEDCRKQVPEDVRRLYSLFDVTLENNLVSLVCHYVTDVCMDETAVSSDPVRAILLDEVVVKDWCKNTFTNIITELCGIYTLKIEQMETKLNLLLKLTVHLNGISSVLDVLESSFKESCSTQLDDLHFLLEDTLKAKQHLEVMTWCIKHQFFVNFQSRFSSFDSWCSVVQERKSAASVRAWAEPISGSSGSADSHGSTLFVEDALLNVGIEEMHADLIREETSIQCLQEDEYLLPKSNVDGVASCYPFQNLRSAADILFLNGTSDMVIAKRAIFLYYLFDRHWTLPDYGWRHLVDDFAAAFGISRYSQLECLIFYLLDDHTEDALKEAICLLPEIASQQAHPKLAQVLLERQCPDAALMVLRWSGHDGFCVYPSHVHDSMQLVSLCDAVTAVRVRIECGLLTEAFMYQRVHILKAKNVIWHRSDAEILNSEKSGNETWMKQLEILVTEICHLCIRRNLVDRMIELPWNADEVKYLHRCLLECALQNPTSAFGSLLVVYYLQRCRYVEAYQVDRKLQNVEQDTMLKTVNRDIIPRMKSVSQWRAGLIDKCLELLPEVQRQQIVCANVDSDMNSCMDAERPLEVENSFELLEPASLLVSPSADSVLRKSSPNFQLKKISSDLQKRSSSLMVDSSSQPSSILLGRLLMPVQSPSTQKMDSPIQGSHIPHYLSSSVSGSTRAVDVHHANGFSLGTQFNDGSARGGFNKKLLKERNRRLSRGLQNDPMGRFEKDFLGTDSNGSNSQQDNAQPLFHPIAAEYDHYQVGSPNNDRIHNDFVGYQSRNTHSTHDLVDRTPFVISPEGALNFAWSSQTRESPIGQLSMNAVQRWRSDESEDEDGQVHERYSGRQIPRRGKFRRK
ncbi:E3 ubiquitin-protein ligase HOS1 [Acorus gramineus]|uniref:E3 ubiquitin-protein ligase HOS1 n=1 Tax=Acorus gramineus TaxID=55184 RepID=A0AAV9A5J6_ACOGR|nr:E3 ubiquitin-protein ligase HOS1 [Acorus gramineus]